MPERDVAVLKRQYRAYGYAPDLYRAAGWYEKRKGGLSTRRQAALRLLQRAKAQIDDPQKEVKSFGGLLRGKNHVGKEYLVRLGIESARTALKTVFADDPYDPLWTLLFTSEQLVLSSPGRGYRDRFKLRSSERKVIEMILDECERAHFDSPLPLQYAWFSGMNALKGAAAVQMGSPYSHLWLERNFILPALNYANAATDIRTVVRGNIEGLLPWVLGVSDPLGIPLGPDRVWDHLSLILMGKR